MTDLLCNKQGLDHTGKQQFEEDEIGRIKLAKCHLLIGCTGSIATLLLPQLLEELASLKYRVCMACCFLISLPHVL